MTAIFNPHSKARRLIQFDLDGLPIEREAAWLAAHLDGCDACQRYAVEMRRLNTSLHQDAQMQQRGGRDARLETADRF